MHPVILPEKQTDMWGGKINGIFQKITLKLRFSISTDPTLLIQAICRLKSPVACTLRCHSNFSYHRIHTVNAAQADLITEMSPNTHQMESEVTRHSLTH